MRIVFTCYKCGEAFEGERCVKCGCSVHDPNPLLLPDEETHLRIHEQIAVETRAAHRIAVVVLALLLLGGAALAVAGQPVAVAAACGAAFGLGWLWGCRRDFR